MYPQSESNGHKRLTPLRDKVLAALNKIYPEDEQAPPFIEDMRSALIDYDVDTKLSEEEKARKRLDMAVESFGKRLDIVLGKESAVIDVTFQQS